MESPERTLVLISWSSEVCLFTMTCLVNVMSIGKTLSCVREFDRLSIMFMAVNQDFAGHCSEIYQEIQKVSISASPKQMTKINGSPDV